MATTTGEPDDPCRDRPVVAFQVGDESDPVHGYAHFQFEVGSRYRLILVGGERTFAFIVENFDPSDFEAFLPLAEQVIRSFPVSPRNFEPIH